MRKNGSVYQEPKHNTSKQGLTTNQKLEAKRIQSNITDGKLTGILDQILYLRLESPKFRR